MTANCQGSKEGLAKDSGHREDTAYYEKPLDDAELAKMHWKKLSGLIITRDQCVQFPATSVRVAHGHCPVMVGLERY